LKTNGNIKKIIGKNLAISKHPHIKINYVTQMLHITQNLDLSAKNI
jgi:hypothetical protein